MGLDPTRSDDDPSERETRLHPKSPATLQ
jgi:hypothetical protein